MIRYGLYALAGVVVIGGLIYAVHLLGYSTEASCGYDSNER